MRRFLMTLCVGVLMTASAAVASAQTFADNHVQISQRTLTYQGILTLKDGTPVKDGDYALTVSLYGDKNGKSSVWRGTYSTHVVGGVFNVLLGSGDYPLPSAQAMDAVLYPGVSIDGGDELISATPISASAYAMNVADGAITSKKMGTDYVSSISLNGQKVTGKGSDLNIVTNGFGASVDPLSNTLVLNNLAAPSSVSSKGDGAMANTTITGTLTVTSSTDLNTSSGNTKIWGNATLGSSSSNAITFNGVGASILDMNSHKIIRVSDPIVDQDVATKHYVDGLVGTGSGSVALSPSSLQVTAGPTSGTLNSTISVGLDDNTASPGTMNGTEPATKKFFSFWNDPDAIIPGSNPPAHGSTEVANLMYDGTLNVSYVQTDNLQSFTTPGTGLQDIFFNDPVVFSGTDALDDAHFGVKSISPFLVGDPAAERGKILFEDAHDDSQDLPHDYRATLQGADHYTGNQTIIVPDASGTLAFIGQGNVVEFDHTGTQTTTASHPRSNYLFNTQYNSSSAAGAALGAVIGADNGNGSNGTGDVNGLTITAQDDNGANTATALSVTAIGGATNLAIDAVGDVMVGGNITDVGNITTVHSGPIAGTITAGGLITANGGVQIPSFVTAGVVRNDASGNLSTGPLTSSDVGNEIGRAHV